MRALGWLGLGLLLLAAGSRAYAAETAGREPPPLPRFDGPLLEQGHAGTDLLHRKRGVILVFALLDVYAEPAARIVKRIANDAAAANIAFLGVSRDPDPQLAQQFARRLGLSFPILRDSDRRISAKLGVAPGKAAVLVVDAQSHVIGGFIGTETEMEDTELAYEAELRRLLHLERRDDPLSQSLGLLPKAPTFRLDSLDGKRKLESTELTRKVVVLVFFSPACPHCHSVLRFLDKLSQRLDHADLVVAPVSVTHKPYVIEDMVKQLSLELPIYVDPEGEARRAYGHDLRVPDLVVIDREGRIVSRQNGADPRIEAIVTMELRQALGVENPLLLDRSGFSGEAACRACHAPAHQTWMLTRHAYAFETLAEHGKEHDKECLPCHTVGWGEKGGYALETPQPHLEGVQCENCHGRGGPHQSPQFLASGFEPICAECHNPKHSLNFVFAERLPEVSHAQNLRFASLDSAERRSLLERRDKRQRTLFHDAEYVGSEACQDCHASEYERWRASPHAHAFATLEAKAAHTKSDCQRCHTTGFDKKSGFPAGGTRLHNVGCESCHGPGARHVAEGAERRGTILGLADKCDSCVVLQICGTCHDDQNDPGFEFEILDKIERIRHGKKPSQESVSR